VRRAAKPKLDSDGKVKAEEAPVFSRHSGKPLKDFRDSWVEARKGTAGADLRFHDLRGEYAPGLVEHGVPLAQVRALLGHASIVTTERYERQKFEMLEVAARKLETWRDFRDSFKCPRTRASASLARRHDLRR